MINLKKPVLKASTLFVLFLLQLVFVGPALAVTVVDCTPDGALSGQGTLACPTKTDEDPITGTLLSVASFFIYLTVAGTLIMALVSGIRMIASSGNSEKVQSARKTLTFALIGLGAAMSIGLFIEFVVSDFIK